MYLHVHVRNYVSHVDIHLLHTRFTQHVLDTHVLAGRSLEQVCYGRRRILREIMTVFNAYDYDVMPQSRKY